MKEDKDTLERAVEALKNEKIPPGPPQELVEATIARLAETAGPSDAIQLGGRIRIRERVRAVSHLNKVAAAAVLLIVASYAVGRLSAPRPPDVKQLQATLEPVLRRDLLNEMNQHLQAIYVRLTDELGRQYRQDLTRTAMQILAASNTVTSERLAELITSIDEAQTQHRRLFATALEQVESNRLRDRALFSDALASFAVQTEDELLRTKRDVAQALSYAMPDSPAPELFKDADN